jgi:acyl carrier protein
MPQWIFPEKVQTPRHYSDVGADKMSDIQERVSRCFSNVFPDLPAKEIPRASMAALADWDSLAHVTLLSSIAEEFGQVFEIEDYEGLVSYPLVVNRLESMRERRPFTAAA